MMKWVRSAIAISIATLLLTSQLAIGQTPGPPKKIGHYKKLFLLSNNLALRTKTLCKTEACAKAADELTVVVADGQDKHKKGQLVQETRKQWHADHTASMTKLRAALIDSLPETEKKAVMNRLLSIPAGTQGLSCSNNDNRVVIDKTPRVRPIQDGGTAEECALCDDVLERVSAICVIYELWCPTCTLICLATAGIAYGRCQLDYCGDPSADNYYGDGNGCDPILYDCGRRVF